MEIRIKKLDENAVKPFKAHDTDAGFDLVATSKVFDKYGAMVYGTGLAFEIPQGYVGLLFPRSSIAKKDLLLSNAVGVLDAGYRGEVMFKFKPSLVTSQTRLYNIGERIGQLIIIPIPQIEFEWADELSDSERGEGGYGSTGL